VIRSGVVPGRSKTLLAVFESFLTGDGLSVTATDADYAFSIASCFWPLRLGTFSEFSSHGSQVLAGHPAGRASLDGLRRAARTKRMAARAPDLNIIDQSMVLRDSEGWQITEAGRALLASIESPAPIQADGKQLPPPERFTWPVVA
jgi:hypothetical protein